MSRCLHSFREMARMMGKGRLMIRFSAPSTKVFLITDQQDGELKKRAKCFSPTQLLPRMPAAGLNSLNASVAPYMGT